MPRRLRQGMRPQNTKVMSPQRLTDKTRLFAGLCLTFFLTFPVSAKAQQNTNTEFLSIAKSAVILYDGPSRLAVKQYIASMHLPVEVLTKVDGWVKVRDSRGYFAWVESENLDQKRFVIVKAPSASIYRSTDQQVHPLFSVQQDVVLEQLETPHNGWLKVRHRDGESGYIRTDQIWGV